MRCSTAIVLVAAALGGTAARGDIYQWEYIDPLQPELGRQQSSTLAPDGAGHEAVPEANLDNLDLTMAWLHEASLQEASFTDSTLVDADLSGAHLGGTLFVRTLLTGADFTNASVRGADFLKVTDTGFTAAQFYSTASYQAGNLSGTILRWNDLTGWNFAGQNLSSAALWGANLTDTDFTGANLTRAQLSWATLAGADFTDARIRGAKLDWTEGFTAEQLYSTASYKEGDLTGVDFSFDDVTGWNFAGQNIANAEFWQTDVVNADFTNADVRGVLFGRAWGFTAEQLYSTASYKARDLTGIDLRHNDVTGWDFADQNLTDAEFWAADLTDTDFTDAIVRGAGFAQVRGFTAEQFYSTASYQAGHLPDIDLARNNLAGWDFSGRWLSHASFAESDLSGANLANASLYDATLTDASLAGAEVRGANFSRATGFTAAQLYSTATYQAGDLSGMSLPALNLTGGTFANMNLTGVRFYGATLTNATFANAEVRDAGFFDVTGFTAEQLYSTASYQRGDLTEIILSGSDLTGWDFSGQNLTDAGFDGPLVGANFTNAVVRGARFWPSTDFTAAQLYSTASYRAGDLTGIELSDNDLTGWSFAGQNLTDVIFQNATLADVDFTGAEVRGANFSDSTEYGLTAPQLYSTASYQARDLRGIWLKGNDLTGWGFAGQDLTDVDFYRATLTGVEFTGATVRGADFSRTDITPAQLYSTSSYQAGDLTGVGLRSADLTGMDVAGMNLTAADFSNAILTGVDFSGAEVRGANFYSTTGSGFTAAQLYSTASYQAGDLTGIMFGEGDLAGWNFAGQNLASAIIYYVTLKDVDLTNANLTATFLHEAYLSGANLSGADARGALSIDASMAITDNFIHPDGHVKGLDIRRNETLRLWDFDPGSTSWLISTPIGDVPIVVEQGMSIDPAGALRMVFEDDQWGSTIHFEPDIPVSLDGTLELLFADHANALSLVGTTYQLFDWTGVTPTGQFDLILTQNGLLWNTRNLYTTGHVTLIGAVPEPSTWMLLAMFLLVFACNYRNVTTRCGT